MEKKFTKGPWNVDSSGFDLIITSIHPFDVVVSKIGHEDMNEDEIEANAKLIAAAPDLLEALMELFDETCSDFDFENESMSKAEKKAQAAIAKALNI